MPKKRQKNLYHKRCSRRYHGVFLCAYRRDTLLYQERDEWIYDGDTSCNLDESVIETMLGKVASITADECLSEPESLDSYGLDVPSGQITLTTDEETVTLFIGNRNAITGSYYLKKDGDDKVYLVSSTVASACTKNISDLLTEEDTETEEPEELSTEELGTEE